MLRPFRDRVCPARHPAAGDDTARDLPAHRANGWFSREEDTLGTIEAGRLADLVVLNADVFDPRAVPDESSRRVHSVLTILGGRVVHGDPKTLR